MDVLINLIVIISHIHMCVYQMVTLSTLNLRNAICQLYLSKAGNIVLS